MIKFTHPNYIYFQLKGEKSLYFLQGQLTCDLNRIKPGETAFGGWLNTKGRIILTLRVFSYQGEWYIQVPSNMAEVLIHKWAKIAALSRVHFTQMRWESYQTMSPLASDIPFIHCMKMDDFSGYLYCLPEGIDTHSENWESFAIKAGQVEIDARLSEQFTPHELEWEKTDYVSFTKGCYTGQEIVARTQYRGKVKSALYTLSHSPISGQDGIGQPIYTEDKVAVGTILRQYNELSLCNILKEYNQVPLYLNSGVQVTDILPIYTQTISKCQC